ncbi:MAG: SPOR domain-containing protein [Rhodanobacter sp.]
MLVRLLFVLLGLGNIALAAWLWLGQPYAVNSLPPGDPGVPVLQLLSELPESATTAAAPASSASIAANATSKLDLAASAERRCLALGPFATPQDLRSARQALADKVAQSRARQEQVTETGSWWVYLPEASSRAQALARARQLADRHVSDYFVVSSGEHANSVSLGLFKDPANARRRLDEVAAAGFPARMSQRTETVPEYWLDLVIPAGTRIDWNALHLDGVQSHDTACF